MTAEDRRARDLMRSEFPRVSEDASLRDALAVLASESAAGNSRSALLVVDAEGHLRGMLATAVLLRRVVDEEEQALLPLARIQEKLDAPVRHAMDHEPPVAAPEDSLLRLIELTADEGWECVPVVEDERVVGVVWLADVFQRAAELALAPRELEQPEGDSRT